MARKLLVEIIADPSRAERGFAQATRSARGFERAIEKTGRGAISASLSFRGLGRAAGFASAEILGGAGIVVALKSTIGAAEESQRVLGQTQNAVTRSGQSWAKYRDQIEKVTLAQSQASGFDDERLKGTFSLLVRRTKDVGEALRLNATAANVARGRNISLEAASQLVIKASLGQAGALRRVGIDAAKNATATQLLAMLNQKYASSAAAYANTAAGAQDRFKVALQNFQEVLGAEALPAITKYLNQGADWLNQTKNQQRVLGDLRAVVGTVKDVIGALTPFVKGAAGAAQGLRHALGGTKNALHALIVTAAAWKAAGLISKFGAVGASAGEAGAAGKIGLLTSRLKTLGAIGVITVGIEIAIHGGQITSAIDDELRKKGLGFLVGGDLNLTPSQVQDMANKGGFAGDVAKKALGNMPASLRPPKAPGSRFFFTDTLPQTGLASGTSGAGSAGSQLTGMAALSRQQRNGIALAQARTPGQELAALAEQRAILARQIDFVRAHLGRAHGSTAKKLADELANLISQDTSAFQQIAGINEQAASAAQATSKRIKDAAAKKKQAMLDSILAASGFTRGGNAGGLGVSGGPLTLADVNKAVTANEKKARAAAAAAEQAAQFRALGLTASGDALAPTRVGLTRETNRLSNALKGTLLDTDKNRNLLGRVRKVLGGQWQSLTRDTRLAIKSMLDAITGELGDKGKLNKIRSVSTKRLADQLTSGLNVSAATKRALEYNIAGAHLTTRPGGNRIDVHNRIDLDGRQVGRSVRRDAAKTARRTARQTSGWIGG